VRQVGQEAPELDGQGLVEAQVGAHRRERGGVRLLPGQGERRVTGQRADAEEHDERRQQQRQHGLPQLVQQIATHGALSPPAGTRRG
jgi:hypothetical protein